VEKNSADYGEEEVLPHLIEISRSSKVELISLLVQKFVLLCGRLHLYRRRKVRWKITCLFWGQGERLKKENRSNKSEILIISPYSCYWDSRVQTMLAKFYILPLQTQCQKGRGWWAQRPCLVIWDLPHREGVSWKSRQRKKKKPKAYFRPKRAQQHSSPQ